MNLMMLSRSVPGRSRRASAYSGVLAGRNVGPIGAFDCAPTANTVTPTPAATIRIAPTSAMTQRSRVERRGGETSTLGDVFRKTGGSAPAQPACCQLGGIPVCGRRGGSGATGCTGWSVGRGVLYGSVIATESSHEPPRHAHGTFGPIEIRRRCVPGAAPALATPAARDHARQPAHSATRQLAHQLLHLAELLDQPVDLGKAGPGSASYPSPPRGVEDLGVASLLGRHRLDDRLGPLELAAVDG